MTNNADQTAADAADQSAASEPAASAEPAADSAGDAAAASAEPAADSAGDAAAASAEPAADSAGDAAAASAEPAADQQHVFSDEEIAQALEHLPGWAHTEGALTWTAQLDKAAQAIALFDRIAAAAEAANHHPDVLWSFNELTVDMSSHDVGGVTVRDLELARKISKLAEAAGATILGLE